MFAFSAGIDSGAAQADCLCQAIQEITFFFKIGTQFVCTL
jgi:hypothetical protein